VKAPASAPIVCADRELGRARPGGRVRLTVRLGAQRATLAAIADRSERPFSQLRHPTIAVARISGNLVTRALPINRDRPHAETLLSPVGSSVESGYLCLVRFHRDEPAVAVVAVNPECMGGCPSLAFYPAVGPSSQQLQVGPYGSTVDTAIGAPVIVTDDHRFFGEFTANADAVDPVRVFTVDGGRLVNVTHDYPLHVERDAAVAWHDFVDPSNGPHDGLGALAAWAADECSLGRQAAAWQTLDQLLHEGRLQGRSQSPGGTRFLHHLRSFLVQTGYAT
jgi:hypothetical protein